MTQATEISPGLVKTREVVGISVKNTQKESLGKIEEIILDKLSGNVRYVVLSFGGVLGMGDKLFALPWNAIHYDDDLECFLLNVDKEKLKNAPGFNKNDWPDMADQAWGRSIHDYYGTRPY